MDPDKIQDDSPASDLACMTPKSFESLYTPISIDISDGLAPIKTNGSDCSTSTTIDSDKNGSTPNSKDSANSPKKEDKIMACVVCQKKFKSKSCMNKHLRSVHAGMRTNSMKMSILPNYWKY